MNGMMDDLISDAASLVLTSGEFAGTADSAQALCRKAAADAVANGVAFSADMLADEVLDLHA